MSGIDPTSQASQSIKPNAAGMLTGKTSESGDGKFGEILQKYINTVNDDQVSAASVVENLLTGKSQDILPVVAAMAKADLSFKLLIGIRNKVIEAYKQTMNMQV